jgi:hypothetical protein
MDRRKHKRKYVYIPRHSPDMHLLHNLHVHGEVYVNNPDPVQPSTGVDMHVPGDLTIDGKIYVHHNIVAGPHDKVCHGNLFVGGNLSVGV